MLPADGEPVLIDVGTGQYSAGSFSSRRYHAWFTQSGFHNVPEVDGVGQGVGRRFRAQVRGQAEQALAGARSAGLDGAATRTAGPARSVCLRAIDGDGSGQHVSAGG